MSVVALVPKTAFLTIMQAIDGMSDGVSTSWFNDPDAFTSPLDAAEVMFKITSYGNDGVDDKRSTFDGTNFTSEQVGWRDVTINVRCEAYNFEAEAADIIEMLLFGLRDDATTAALNAVGMAYQSASPSQDLPTTYDDRLVSLSICDLLFSVVDDRATTGGYIGTVNDATDVVPGTFT